VDFYNDILHRDHFILTIAGETGSDKSSAAQELAMARQQDFRADQIQFESELLLTEIEKSRPGDVFIRDEALPMVGIGSGRIENEIHIVLDTLRQRKNSLILVSPSIERVATSHYNLETVDISDDQQYVRLGVKEPLTDKFIGYILVKIHYNNPVWKEYQLRKMAFLKRVVSRRLSSGANIPELARKVLEKLDLENLRRKAELHLAVHEEYPNLTTGEEKLVYTKLEQLVRIERAKRESLRQAQPQIQPSVRTRKSVKHNPVQQNTQKTEDRSQQEI
jgi:hypothetical protein